MESKDKIQDEDISEKPLSPILPLNRKLILKKMQRKSRVKLTDRFSEGVNLDTKKIDGTPCELTDETLTLSQIEEAVENENSSKIDQNECSFEFKKPDSSFTYLKKMKKSKDLMGSQDTGFITAGGKNIDLRCSDEAYKKARNLFYDILNPGDNTQEYNRCNKYSFLSKGNHLSETLSNDQRRSKSNEITVSTSSKFVQDVSETRKILNTDLKLTGGNININCYQIDNEDMRLLNTQETHQLFSNFTITKDRYGERQVVSNPLETEGFKGYNDDSIEYSQKRSKKFIAKIIEIRRQNEERIYRFATKKTMPENLTVQSLQNLPGTKLEIAWRPLNKAQREFEDMDLPEHLKCGGFSSASGKKITLAQSSIKDAINKFNEEFGDVKFLEIDDKNQEKNLLNTQETHQLFGNLTVTEKQLKNELDLVLTKNSTEQFKGFHEYSIEESNNKADLFMTLFLRHCDNEETLRPVFNTRSPLQDLDNLTLKSFSFKNEGSTTFSDSRLLSQGQQIIFRNSSELKSTLKTLPPFNQQDENVGQNSGFQTAAGTSLKLSNSALSRAARFFENIDNDLSWNTKSNAGFKTAAGRTLMLSEDALNKANKIFQNIDDLSLNNSDNLIPLPTISKAGFQNAAGKTDRVSESDRSKANIFFENIDSIVPVSNRNDENMQPKAGFRTAAGTSLRLSDSALSRAKRIFDDIDADMFHNNSNELIPIAKQINNKSSKPRASFQITTGTPLRLSDSALSQAKQNIDSGLNYSSNSSGSATQDSIISLGKRHSTLSNGSKSSKKKRLGISSCRQIQIPEHKIEKAKQLFEDEKNPIMSPIRINKPIFNSTPLKNVSIATLDSDITPIKSTKNTNIVNSKVKREEDSNSSRILIRDCTRGNIESWSHALEKERRELEAKLKLIVERQEALALQKQFFENVYQDQRRRRCGVLFHKRQNTKRIPIQNYLEVDSSSIILNNITPQNAEFVHFNLVKENVSAVTTLDGACVIPNINSLIGLTEIEAAFKIMPGVDPKLIPKGWIQNNFKWIVWKLASYENFAVNTKDCLTVENVIQQLKYRYDREIDRAERPTLRKIFETDDVPQKRMVLCVSNIFDLGNSKFELELTDGWYSIRTVIDDALCGQIAMGRVQIGTKLITCGAELLNCEGCHPLEAIDMVRLKINSNSTRRAKWYSKLGYQKYPEPFPLKLHSILPNGGLIGCIKIYVARIYPIKYMEKQNKLTVWRNRKAEELRAQEYENKSHQDIEKIRERVRKSCEMDLQISKQRVNLNLTDDEIKSVNCPETLFNLYQNSRDPESLQEILSQSQKQSVMDYQRRLILKQHQQISRQMEDSVMKLETTKRDVTPVLQLLVVDAIDSDEKWSILHIWKPTDTHLEIIRESSIFYVFNVLPKKNGGFSTISRTKFQSDSEKRSDFSKYKRILFPISELLELSREPLFKEFDTVGIVVTLSINSYSQTLWLADPSGRLLFIKIFENPKNCLLLDKLKNGQLIAVSNLIYCESKLEFGEAEANHLTVISSYPQHKHLQEGMNSLSASLPRDLTLFLEECNQKISYHMQKVDITKGCKNVSSRSLAQDNSITASDIFDESSDVLYSMIDIEKFT